MGGHNQGAGPPETRDGEQPPLHAINDARVMRPIVFVPGIMGSRIVRMGTQDDLWPPFVYDTSGLHLGHTMDLIHAGPAGREAVGPFPFVYDNLLLYLRRLRGTRNVHEFYYDWTQSNLISGQGLAAFIQGVLDRQEYHGVFDAVDVVNHSMGGIVTRSAYMLVPGAASQIRRVAYIASPHYGAPKAHFVLHPGVDVPLYSSFTEKLVGWAAWQYLKKADDNDTLAGEIKDLMETMPSAYELLPDSYYWEGTDSPVSPSSPAGGPGVRYMVVDDHLTDQYYINGTQNTYNDPDWGFPPGRRGLVDAAMQFKNSLTKVIPPDDATRRLLIYSAYSPTLDAIPYKHYLGINHFGTPYATSGNGDETVPMSSASAQMRLQPNVVNIPGTHSGLPEITQTYNQLGPFLQAPPA